LIIGYSLALPAVRATGAQHLVGRNGPKDILSCYLIVPQIKQFGAAIVADVTDPTGHQSVVGKSRLGYF
jgi:hypothetical protein